jgi:hypothetical protein
LKGKIFRTGTLISNIPIKSILEADVVYLDVKFQRAKTGRLRRLVGTMAGDSLANGVANVAFKVRQSGVFSDD